MIGAERYRSHTCAGAADALGARVRLSGWVHRRRDHGGVVFIDLRDRSGIVQLVFHPDAPEAHAAAGALSPEDVIRVEGEVAEVCQMAGCWLTFQNEAGVSFRVAVPRNDDGGYAFTFPRDAAGSRVLVQGTLDVTETDAATRRHLAEDAGASPEEVAAISEPERTVVLNATGARVE